MTDSELDKKLNGARTPNLDRDYVEDFPRLIAMRLHPPTARKISPERHWLPRLAWSAGFLSIFLIIVFGMGHWRRLTEGQFNEDVLVDSKFIQETLAMFPNRVRAIVQDEHGMNLVLSDKENVPASIPIYVRICDGKNCSSLVTFSGQELEFAGQKLTVLSEADGGIILMGNKFIWYDRGQPNPHTNLKIEARNIGPATM